MAGLAAASWDWINIWERSRESWHWPQLPRPRLGGGSDLGGSGGSLNSACSEEFPFENYALVLKEEEVSQGPLYVENLFDHLIVHYIFCPRSLETSAILALAAIKGLKEPLHARRMINIFSDIVVDSFRLERSGEDERKVLLGWQRLAEKNGGKDRSKGKSEDKGEGLSPLDRLVLGFLREYWGISLPQSDLPEVDLLLHVFSPGVRDKSLWARQCQQTARILEPFSPGLLGKGPVRSVEMLNGSAHAVPLALASMLEPSQYERVLSIIGLNGDLKRWYRDQSYSIEIRSFRKARECSYPSGLSKWRHTDPLSELDVAYSLSMSPRIIPGVTTYKRELESSLMAPGQEEVPNLLVVLDSSRSMDGHTAGSKTQKATIAAFKACQFAHQQGAELAAINFSDKSIVQPWTRDLSAVEDVLVEYFCGRTHIPGQEALKLAKAREGCLIICITDTHIQNLYTEWEWLKEASQYGDFVLFCIDQAGKDRYVEEALSSLGTVYYLNRLEDLIGLVVETTERAYDGNGKAEGLHKSCNN